MDDIKEKHETFNKESKAMLETIRERFGCDGVVIIATFKHDATDEYEKNSACCAMGMPVNTRVAMPAVLHEIADELFKENAGEGLKNAVVDHEVNEVMN